MGIDIFDDRPGGIDNGGAYRLPLRVCKYGMSGEATENTFQAHLSS
jgi:hypothetical protein